MAKLLRVWYMDRVPAEKSTYIPVKNIEEAKLVINAFIKRDLNDERITDNAMGLEQKDGKGWGEYYDEEGRDIDEIME